MSRFPSNKGGVFLAGRRYNNLVCRLKRRRSSIDASPLRFRPDLQRQRRPEILLQEHLPQRRHRNRSLRRNPLPSRRSGGLLLRGSIRDPLHGHALESRLSQTTRERKNSIHSDFTPFGRLGRRHRTARWP